MAVGLPSAGVVRYCLSSGQNEVAEYDWAGQRLRYYVHGPTYIDERVVMHNDPVAGGAATTGSDYVYLLKDLYTVAGMADERGWPVERYDYDAYGKVYMERVRVLPWAADFDGDGDVDADDLAVLHAAYKGSGQEPNGPRGWRADLDGDGDVDGSDYALFADAYRGSGVAPGGNLLLRSASMAVSRIGNPYFFTGRRLDVIDIQNAGTPHLFTDDYAGLQVYDYRARTYDPVVGRFQQRDPLRFSDGMSLYGYVDGGPATHVDPDGLAKQKACCSYKMSKPYQKGTRPTSFTDITYDDSSQDATKACDCWAKNVLGGQVSDLRAESNSCDCGIKVHRASTIWKPVGWEHMILIGLIGAWTGIMVPPYLDMGHSWFTSPTYDDGWGGGLNQIGWKGRRPDMEASVSRKESGDLRFGGKKGCGDATCQDIIGCMREAASDFNKKNVGKWFPGFGPPQHPDPWLFTNGCTDFVRSVLDSCCMSMGEWR